MKATILVALLLGGMTVNTGSLTAATATTKKSITAKKRTTSASVRRKAKPHYKPAPPVDPTIGDNVDGEDLEIRRAAVEALGTMNGSVVVADPTNGRILSIVNQKLALTGGHTPCSTIKLVTSVAALTEHVVSRETFVPTGRRVGFNMTNALAHSDNQYFSILGNRLGFERVTKYAQMLGLGELAGFDIPGEQPGTIPAEAPKWGGLGIMTAFGGGFELTPLQLTALVSAVANGGTLYYLQYPRTAEEIENFTPKVKRTLDIAPNGFEDIKTGMRGAVEFGTARRANYDPSEPILGKTGTCTDFRVASHMGWFGSFNEVNHHQLVVVVMLMGTKSINGPVASGVAGAVYHKLSAEQYFVAEGAPAKKNGLPEIITTFVRD
jgi:cell division protein FtsI/penicillin-binding protein 2